MMIRMMMRITVRIIKNDSDSSSSYRGCLRVIILMIQKMKRTLMTSCLYICDS